jgi:hypothetical protein
MAVANVSRSEPRIDPPRQAYGAEAPKNETQNQIDLRQRLVVKEMQKKALGQVLRVGGTVSATPDKCIKRKPVELAQLGKRSL